MAECSPNAQTDEDDRWEECMETFESTENTFQLDPNASNQENKPTTRDKNVWNAPGESDSRNGKNSLGETSIIVYKLSCLFFNSGSGRFTPSCNAPSVLTHNLGDKCIRLLS